ncbi:MAG: hypothetical protein CVU39_07090 [Chloroflexi bacterium HGW-Chloroflexi-10]|nr:MAG: hypothetical protein CVU39_07090 [Chloroflexi bacterium HGW-Chloroflexi-10]
MTIQKYQKVYSVNSTLQAMHVQNVLEQAGLPVTIVHASNATYLDVLVPAAWIEQAQQMLYPSHPCGEIYFPPQKAI